MTMYLRRTVSPIGAMFLAAAIVGAPLFLLLGAWALVVLAVLGVAFVVDVARRRPTRRARR